MRVSYNWLRQYVDIPWSVEELAHRLTMSGTMVETMEYMGEGLDDIVVGRVVALNPHPHAEQLVVAEVDVGAEHGDTERLTIVTGAPNVATGQYVAVAPPGARLPGGQRIEATDLRGVTSEGMLCSEAELGVGDDASGIWVLPPDVVAGTPLVDALHLDDTVFDLEVYPNRPDCFSVIGIAREVAALTGGTLRLPSLELEETEPSAATAATVQISDTRLCSRYLARVLEDVHIGPSPAWLQQRLRVAGMRPINNIVDITNFVMWEWGQPLHAFDLDRLGDGHINVRRATDGESFVTLDGEERKLTADMLVIADAKNPVAVAGVMGGADSEVTETTGRILLESATFDGVSVRRTAQRFGLRTEASHRFEKGLDPNVVPAAAARAARLMQHLAGATVFAGAVDEYPTPRRPRIVKCRVARVNRLLGVELSKEEMARHLRALGMEVEDEDVRLAVTVPTFRPDVRGEADLTEEIARLHGFDELPARLPAGSIEVGGQRPPLPFLDKVRDLLIGFGLHETVTYSFTDLQTADKLRWDATDPRRDAISLRNPLNKELSVMRTSLVGGLLETAAHNVSRRVTAVHIFEVGAVYLADSLPLQKLPVEARRIGVLMTGALPRRRWGTKDAPADFFHAKGVLESLFQRIGVEVEFAPSDDATMHPGRQAVVSIDGTHIGLVGEVHPDVAAAYDLDHRRVYVAELDADALAAAAKPTPMFAPLPRYPAVERDIALIVPETVPAADILRTIRAEGGQLIETIRLFDVYEGSQVEAGHRSLAYALTLRAPDRTLTDEEANDVIGRVEKGLARRYGVTLRR